MKIPTVALAFAFLPALLATACAHTDDVRDLVPSDVTSDAPHDVASPTRIEDPAPAPKKDRPRPALPASEPAPRTATAAATPPTHQEPSDDLVGLLGSAFGALTQSESPPQPAPRASGTR